MILIYWIFCQLTVLSFIDYLSVDSFEFFMILEEKLLILIVKWHLGLLGFGSEFRHPTDMAMALDPWKVWRLVL